MTRLSYRLYLLATGLNYRVPRRLTKAGLLAATGMLLAAAIGTDVDQSLAFESFALLLALFVVASIWAPFFRGPFVVRRLLPRLASVGRPFQFTVQVRNASGRSYHHLELLEDLADPRPTLAEFARLIRPPKAMRAFRLAKGSSPRFDSRQAIVKPIELPGIEPGGAVDVRVELMPLRRGPLRFKGVTVARRDPLGLVRGFVRQRLPQTVLVLPRRYPVPPFAFPGTRQYQPGGVALASAIGESEEFVSLREYRPGDPLRRIHWRSWARAGRPIVKEYQDEFFVRHGLVLDTFAELAQADEFEEAVSVAASFACTLQSQDSLLDLLFVGGQAISFTTGRGLGQAEQVLEILASVRPSPDPRFEALSDLVLRHAERLSGCICVLVGWDEPRRELVRRLQALGVPTLTFVLGNEATQAVIQRDAGSALCSDVRVLRSGKIAEDLLVLDAIRT